MSIEKPFDETAISSYTDVELLHYITNSPHLQTTRPEAVRRLSSHLVAKPVPYLIDPQDEVLAMERARSVGVPVPVVHRVVPYKKGRHFLVMNFVDGMTLEQLWKTIGLLATVRLALQLRSHLCAMATVNSQTTGGLHSGQVRSEWIHGVYGPVDHASPPMFTNHLNWWLTNFKPPQCDFLLEPSLYHILVHQDLAPRNMILDRKDRLWIIDWGHAGFYPPFMEYVGIEPGCEAMPWIYARTWTAWCWRLKWSLFRWVACGFGWRYKKQLTALSAVRQRSLTYRFARGPHSAGDVRTV
ncbi:kinase-like protein [Schizophyllum commune]